MMKDKLRVRLEPDVAKLVKKSAKLNGRSIPGEINHTLRWRYQRFELSKVIGLSGEPAPNLKSDPLAPDL